MEIREGCVIVSNYGRARRIALGRSGDGWIYEKAGSKLHDTVWLADEDVERHWHMEDEMQSWVSR